MSPPVLYDGRFMQLNPARGRKPSRHYGRITLESNEVYAAQPREGTETLQASSHLWWFPRFMQLNPARGRKLCGSTGPRALCGARVYAAQPREGTETVRMWCAPLVLRPRFMQLNPARGRKPKKGSRRLRGMDAVRFMQLNPARGRKLHTSVSYE